MYSIREEIKLILDELSIIKLKEQWNDIAEIRFNQQSSGSDLSYAKYLKPAILKFLDDNKYTYILDLGCGNGDLTKELSKYSNSIIGLDFSYKNIELAKNYNHSNNIQYICDDAGEYLSGNNAFDLIIANMFLQDYQDLPGIIEKVYNNLAYDGRFIFTITHPLYWPKYWRYENEPWFDYKKEIIIEAPFKISSDKKINKNTIHFHRPLEMYINNLQRVGFNIEISKDIITKGLSPFNFPKFWAVACIK